MAMNRDNVIMIAPKNPPNEQARLSALYSLNILDSAAEERFDRITRVAKQIFNVPIAVISIVEKDRQWFKSIQGLDATETPRAISFCGHAILNDDIMIVEDASKDERFFDNPFVQDSPNIKFYSGCPIKIKEQYNIGTLCLIDNKSRQFSKAEQAILRDLVAMVQAELELMHLSTTDELTRLTNRRGFLSIGRHVFKVNERNDNPMSVLFFDLNKFKEVNDTHGHAAGDEVLKAFAEHLLHTFRTSDLIARLGGDEFCVLLSCSAETHITQMLQRLQQTIEWSKDKYPIKYSVGYLLYDKNKHNSLEEMIDDADTKMYEDKRNTV